MGRLSAEEEATLKRLQAAKEAPDDEDTAVWVRNAAGHETRLTGARAERWLRSNGYSEDEAEESTADAPLPAKKAAAPGKKAAPAKRAAKPAPAAPAEDDLDDDEDGAEEETDVQPRGGRRAFF